MQRLIKPSESIAPDPGSCQPGQSLKVRKRLCSRSLSFSAILWSVFIVVSNIAPVQAASLKTLAEGEHRSPGNIARNTYRHPVETLQFFGIRPDMTVVEIWPGGGWYTEIIAPFLAEQGTFYGAHFAESQTKPFFKNKRENYIEKLSSAPDVYGQPKVTGLYPPFDALQAAPAGSADMVLTFRNVHNWTKGGFDQEMFNTFYRLLKPGGILGVVEHRAKPETSLEDMIRSGYMTESYVVKRAKNAGFDLVASSEINANPRDAANHPNGVWSLPPSLRGPASDNEKYQAIGESDRMTLKFLKPTVNATKAH